jgi:hypothetical protein
MDGIYNVPGTSVPFVGEKGSRDRRSGRAYQLPGLPGVEVLTGGVVGTAVAPDGWTGYPRGGHPRTRGIDGYHSQTFVIPAVA